MDKLFINSIEQKNFELFKKCPKGNLHTHALLSSNRKYFFKYYKRNLKQFMKSDNIFSLTEFIKDNILDITITPEGQLKLFELTIQTAILNGVTVLDTSVDYRSVLNFYNNDVSKYISDLNNLKNKYSKEIKINFDLGIARNAYNESHESIIIELIKTNFFSGIDLFGDELSKDISIFKNIYLEAKNNNMILKAHVGEFGNAEDVLVAIETLNLDVIQHGIAVVEDNEILKKVKDKNVIFNVCPISNLHLNRVKDIKKHPIKKMFDEGLKVTINTDDELIFNNSLFDEYMLLYKNNVFNAIELNEIRKNSLISFN